MTTAEKIFYLEKECFNDCWSIKSLESQLSSEQNICVLYEENDEPVAYALGNEICGEAELYRIAVLKQHRGKGLGKRMMNEFLSECRRRNAEKVFLEVRSRNEAAVSLYKKSGFEQISVRKGYYGDDDGVIFLKIM